MTKRINSRSKGCRGERELAQFLTERGFVSRRGQQFSGGTESPDVVCQALRGWHIEVKRVEAGNLYNWLRQAKEDAGKTARRTKKKPLVCHRKSQQEWVVILRLEDFLEEFLLNA